MRMAELGKPDARRDLLERVSGEIRACRACVLHEGTRQAVPGEGNPDAEILLIGEAPGQNEDLQGRPFVGASGHFLTEMLRQNGLRREDVFIANVVKHRPPNNRDPLPDEIEACASFLSHQIDAIDPLVIITLGRFSLAKFFPGEKISQIHGQPRKIGGRTVIPLYHPAAALHQGALRKVLEADFAKVPGIVDVARRAAGRTAPPAAAPLPGELVQQAFMLLQNSAEKLIGEGVESSTDLTGTAAPKPPRQLPLL